MTSLPQIRRANLEDADVCGPICFEAFSQINKAHNFPPDVPSTEAGVAILRMLFSHPGCYCVVAELDGQVVGSNCMDERSPIGGIGPITVSPSVQNRNVGRALMNAVLDRAHDRGLAGIRLVQSAFHSRSLSLYTKLGFDAREPLSLMQGPSIKTTIQGVTVRPAREADLDAANQVCQRVHGHERSGELRDSIQHGTASVVERQGRITGYASSIAFFGHAACESNLDLMALIANAERFDGPGILIPTRNSELLRWCLQSGLRVLYPLTLMSIGLYNNPAGAYLPSISY